MPGTISVPVPTTKLPKHSASRLARCGNLPTPGERVAARQAVRAGLAAGEQPGEREADEARDGLGALPPCRGLQFGNHCVFDSHDSSFQANETAALPPSE